MARKLQENKLLLLAQIELLVAIIYILWLFFSTPFLIHFLALEIFLVSGFIFSLIVYVDSKNKSKISLLSAFILLTGLGFWLEFMPKTYNILNNLLIALPAVLILLNIDEVKKFILEGGTSK